MSSATINFNVMPRRMLSLQEAAKYVGLDAKRFSACAVPPIDMPGPGEIKRYDMRDLDQWVDQIKAGAADTDEAILSLLDKKAG